MITHARKRTKMKTTKEEQAQTNWKKIEADYCAGIKKVQEIADEHGLTKGAISNRAKRYDWTRNLAPKIKAKAEEIVNKVRVNKDVNKSKKFTPSENEVIKSAAELQAGVIIQETEEIKRLCRIADEMETKLEQIGQDIRDGEALAKELGEPVEFGDQLLELDKRAKIMKQLTEVREKIINLRRRNFGINDNANGEANQQAVRPEDLVGLNPAEQYKRLIEG